MAERVTQIVEEALISYSNPTSLRVTQGVKEALISYSNPTSILASQVVIEVLRSEADAGGGARSFGGII